MPTRPSAYPYQGASPSKSRMTKVLNDLGLAIVSGQFEQGSLLPGDAELTRRYDVSRTVVREALKSLGAKGLVQPKARVGTSVRQRAAWNLFDPEVLIWHAQIGLSADFLKHLGEMRLALEPVGAALAAQRRSAADLKDLRAWTEMMAEPEISPRDFVEADLGLHLSVARAAGNPFLLSVSTLIEVALVAMLTVSSPAEEPDRLAESVAQHQAVIDAIEAGDARAAEAAMRVVVQVGIDRSQPGTEASAASA
ncbi:MAG: FadR/GntR family transcriptional regulator [Devosia sp.]|nr:FadR/GntR family transcriptional regulator [Devosia sp.]